MRRGTSRRIAAAADAVPRPWMAPARCGLAVAVHQIGPGDCKRVEGGRLRACLCESWCGGGVGRRVSPLQRMGEEGAVAGAVA